jgi:glyoxylase-like metal-dependent hydrolase (beta-lactamase superfamily II)
MEPGSYLELPPGFDSREYWIKPSRVTRRLKHLERIDLGNRTLTVHHTPGKTPGGICLQDNRHGLLFTGDIFYPGTLWVHLEESDFQKYRNSLKYLCDLLDRIGRLCPAHNEASVDKVMLPQALAAFDQIAAGRPPDLVQEETMVHHFQRFNVALPGKAWSFS